MTGVCHRPPLRVILADDHAVFRQGLRAIFEAFGGIEVVAESCDGSQAVTDYLRERPDVLIVDLRMPDADGFDVASRVLAADPSACILMLTTYGTDHDVRRAFAAGIKGYLLKDVEPLKLVDTLHRLAAGDAVWRGNQVGVDDISDPSVCPRRPRSADGPGTGE